MPVSLAEIQNAAARLADQVPVTPVAKALFLSDHVGRNVWLKLENLNLSGSFKIRGATNALLTTPKEKLKAGVVAASAGNHAQGVAYTCRLLGVKAKIFMPMRTPLVKVSATRSLGAEVEQVGHLYDDAFAAAQEYLKHNGGVLVQAFADEAVINGQGTCGLEILDQVPDLGAVIIPIGGGGLGSGVACAIKSIRPDIKIIGVQVQTFPAMQKSLQIGHLVHSDAAMTIADGIAVKRPSPMTYDLIKKYFDDIVLVSDDQIAAAIMDLMEKGHMLAEGAGAASVAALRTMPTSLLPNAKQSVCCIISGGNIDVNLFSRIANRGLLHSGRMMRIIVRTQDQPGKLAEILNAVSKTGANLIDVRHNRNFGAMYYSDVDIELDLETSSFAHQDAIRSALDQVGVAHHDFKA